MAGFIQAAILLGSVFMEGRNLLIEVLHVHLNNAILGSFLSMSAIDRIAVLFVITVVRWDI